MKFFIFSSTATVYAEDAPQPLAEGMATVPINSMRSFQTDDGMDAAEANNAHDFNHMVLRYLPRLPAPIPRAAPAGPHPTPPLPPPPPRWWRWAGWPGGCSIFWATHYPTPDGTGVRDYIHVTDLAAAHLLALDRATGGAAAPRARKCWAMAGAMSVRERQ